MRYKEQVVYVRNVLPEDKRKFAFICKMLDSDCSKMLRTKIKEIIRQHPKWAHMADEFEA